MKNRELIAILNELNPDAEVCIMTSHHGGDDVTDWQVYAVHDAWNRNVEHDMVSIEINLDDRPDYFTFPEYDRIKDSFAAALKTEGLELIDLESRTNEVIQHMTAAGLVDTYQTADGIEMVQLTAKGKGELPH